MLQLGREEEKCLTVRKAKPKVSDTLPYLGPAQNRIPKVRYLKVLVH